MSGNFLSLAARRAEPENRRSAECRWLPGCRIFHPERERRESRSPVRALRAAWACSGVLDDIALRTGDQNKGPRENAAGEPSRPRRSRRISGRPRGPGAPPCETDRPRRAEASPRRMQAPARRHRAEFPDSVLRKCIPICLADMFWSRTWRSGDPDRRTLMERRRRRAAGARGIPLDGPARSRVPAKVRNAP